MQKYALVFLLFAVSSILGAPDFQLLNDSSTQTHPRWIQTSLSSQPPPLNAKYAQVSNTQDSVAFGGNHYAPALYWGNTFTVKNIRPQNDSVYSVGRKRLNPSYHFSVENQTIAMEGQEYLIRPRGYIIVEDPAAGKRAPRPLELPLNGQWTNVGRDAFAALALNVTPQWAAFRLTNSSNPTTETIAFFDSETVNSTGASFTFWASNPSAAYWLGPGASVGFNISDPSQAQSNTIPAPIVQIEWLAACRWIANGTDCGDDGVGQNDICALVEDGLCWARFDAPNTIYLQWYANGELVDSPTVSPTLDTLDAGSWSIRVTPRPLTLWSPETNHMEYSRPTGTIGSVEVEVFPNRNSPAFVIGLPLNNERIAPDEARDFTMTGSTSNEWLNRFMPGKDGAGGTLEITVRTVIEVPDTVEFPNQVSRAVSHIQMVPPKLIISKAQPTASFYFTNVTLPKGVEQYVVHFLVTETSPSTISIANSTTALGDQSGIYPNGAYSIPVLILTPVPYEFDLPNFPPGDTEGGIQMPISPEALFNCSAPSNSYVARLSTSPDAAGQDLISLPFNITPSGALKFWTCDSSSKRQSAPTEITSFDFVGATTTVAFYITTQSSPINPVTVSFGTAVVSDPAALDPSSLIFDQNGTFTFFVTQNEVGLKITNNGNGYDPTGGPFVNQDFYMQFQWTPPTRNGFAIAVTGLYTTFPANAVVSNSGTTGTFTVPAGATGFLAGPFRATSPTNIQTSEFQILYGISLVPRSGGASDESWYKLSSALEAVTISIHRFAVINAPNDGVPVFTSGTKSQPVCIGPAFTGALSAADEVWVSIVPTDLDQRFLIFEPVVTTPGVKPPNALVLTAANPVACFTARYDVNWQIDLASGEVVPSGILSGPSATNFQYGVQYIANMPTFNLLQGVWPLVESYIAPSAYVEGQAVFLVGETALITVSLSSALPNDLLYNLSLPSAVLTPISAGAGQFNPGGPVQHLWQATFDVLPVSENSNNHAGAQPQQSWESRLETVVSGADGIYLSPTTNTVIVTVLPRLFHCDVLMKTSSYAVGYLYPALTCSLTHPVVNSLTLTPTLLGDSGALEFDPPSFTFTPASVASVDFFFRTTLLGEYEFALGVSGPDMIIFAADDDTPTTFSPITVEQRYPPVFSVVNEPLLPGKPNAFIVSMRAPVLEGEDVQLVLDLGGDFDNAQVTVDLADAKVGVPFTWTPQVDLDGDDVLVRASLTGVDSWQYLPPTDKQLVATRLPFSVNFADMNHMLGVRYSGYVTLSEPTIEGFQLILSNPHLQFFAPGATTPSSNNGLYLVTFAGPADGRVHYFEYTVSMAAAAFGKTSQQDSDAIDLTVTCLLNPTFDGNRYYLPIAPITFEVKPRLVVPVAQQTVSDASVNKRRLMVNRESSLHTVFLSAPSASPLTVTLTAPQLRFNDGQTSAVLQFAPGQLTATYTVTAVAIPDNDYTVPVDIVVSGAEAEWYLVEDLSFDVIPALGFSPIPVVFTDGAVSGLKVWLIDALAQGFTYSSHAEFRLAVTPSELEDAVYIEPSVLHFSPSALQNNRLSQEFSITHVRPSRLQYQKSYALIWKIFFAGSDADGIDISEYVPLDARRVLLARYQIIPEFPERLNFGWQKASINVSRAPTSHLTFTPTGPFVDGATNSPLYGGAHTAGGRMVFDPPTIVVAPGQQVVHFDVKAIAGSDQNAIYYRVDWVIDGNIDDMANYLDWSNNQVDFYQQSNPALTTWHVASGASLCLSFAVLIASALFLLA